MGQKNNKSKKNFNSNNQQIFSQQTQNNNFQQQQSILKERRNLIKTPILVRIPQVDDPNLPIVSVIVTIYSGASYDNLFREVKQQAPEGRVSLFSADLNSIDKLYNYLNGEDIPSNEDSKTEIEELIKEMNELEPDCVLFNFECCAGCETYVFPKSKETMQLMKLLLDRGHMVMCSDFAVMALINDWDSDYLNSNPFMIVGYCNTAIQLYFEPEVLAESESEQLKVVGKVCSTGEAGIHAMGGTVVFAVDPKKTDSSVYDLTVLTIVTKTSGYNIIECLYPSTIGDKKGTCGHAMLKYKSGGILLLSAGHWIELNNLNVDCSNIENIASGLYGNKYQSQIENIKNNSNLNENQRKMELNKMANEWVQQSAPCKYSKKANKK